MLLNISIFCFRRNNNVINVFFLHFSLKRELERRKDEIIANVGEDLYYGQVHYYGHEIKDQLFEFIQNRFEWLRREIEVRMPRLRVRSG